MTTTSTANVFPEETLVGRLQAGQLDAGFFYAVEASAANIPTVSLGSKWRSSATYTITRAEPGARTRQAAIAFVSFLSRQAGRHDPHQGGAEADEGHVSADTSRMSRRRCGPR